jgi:hypothetical protein
LTKCLFMASSTNWGSTNCRSTNWGSTNCGCTIKRLQGQFTNLDSTPKIDRFLLPRRLWPTHSFCAYLIYLLTKRLHRYVHMCIVCRSVMYFLQYLQCIILPMLLPMLINVHP